MINQLDLNTDSFDNQNPSTEDLVDVNLMQIAKQNNFMQAFEKNLKTKKDEIIKLESNMKSINEEQEVKFIKLLHLKKQREFYQA